MASLSRGDTKPKKANIAKGRIFESLAKQNFPLEKAFIILAGGHFDDLVFGAVGLKHADTVTKGAAGAADNLSEQRKGPLVGSKVAVINGLIGAKHPTRLTLSKSSPLATICVPTRMSYSPFPKAESFAHGHSFAWWCRRRDGGFLRRATAFQARPRQIGSPLPTFL